ncbi:recombinase family protein [bacterium]|nr:recombinase family protein [bacterium]
MIALYPRVSTQEQAINGNSINEQIERMKNYCIAMGWTSFEIYNDAGYSGANIDRPALQKMIEDIKKGKINKVLVYKLDRLSRSQKDTLFLIEDIFLANGCDFVSMTENFDTSTPLGRAMIGILSVFAQLEREQIKERLKMGKIGRAKKGQTNCGNRPPIGYDYENGNLIVNEYEKMLVQRVFKEYLTGKTSYGIAKILNDAGLRHKYGHWLPSTVTYVLRNKTYLGLVIYGDNTFQAKFPALIDEKTFTEVQTLMEKNSLNHSKKNMRTGKANSYLGGLIYCGKCGGKYFKRKIKYNNHEYNYYTCFNKIQSKGAYGINTKCTNKYWKMDELNNIIISEIQKLALDPTYISSIKPVKNENSQIDILEKKISDIDSQVNKLMDLYSLGTMPIDLLQNKVVELNEQKEKIIKELHSIQKERKLKMSYNEAMKAINSFDDVLERGDLDEIRLVMKNLIDKIVVDGENLTIYWAFD